MQYLALFIIMLSFLQASNCRSLERASNKISLISAVKQDKLEKVTEYLCQGADPNSKDAYGTTALHWACYYNKTGKIIKVLLDAGAKIDEKDIDGWISFDCAYNGSNESAIKQLIQKAVDLKNLTIRGQDGKSLLHYAAMLADKEANTIVEHLLALGLYPNAKDNAGCIPLDYAKRQDVKVQLLLHDTPSPIAYLYPNG